MSCRCPGASWRLVGFRYCCLRSDWDMLHCPQRPKGWREVRGSAGCWGQAGNHLYLTSPGSGTAQGSAPKRGIYCRKGKFKCKQLTTTDAQSAFVSRDTIIAALLSASLLFQTSTVSSSSSLFVFLPRLSFLYYFSHSHSCSYAVAITTTVTHWCLTPHKYKLGWHRMEKCLPSLSMSVSSCWLNIVLISSP